jgi:glutamate-1-semialdehyde aminotransferase
MFRLHFTDAHITNYESFLKSWDEKAERVFDAELLRCGIFMPPAHTAFCSLPMGNREISKFENAVDATLPTLKAS